MTDRQKTRRFNAIKALGMIREQISRDHKKYCIRCQNRLRCDLLRKLLLPYRK